VGDFNKDGKLTWRPANHDVSCWNGNGLPRPRAWHKGNVGRRFQRRRQLDLECASYFRAAVAARAGLPTSTLTRHGVLKGTGALSCGLGRGSTADPSEAAAGDQCRRLTTSSHNSIDPVFRCCELSTGLGARSMQSDRSSGTRHRAGDLNGDGKVDLAIEPFGDDVSVLLGTGTGPRSCPNYAVGRNPSPCWRTSTATARSTRDGQRGGLTVLLGTGTGFFRAASSTQARLRSRWPSAILMATAVRRGVGQLSTSNVWCCSTTGLARRTPSITVNDDGHRREQRHRDLHGAFRPRTPGRMSTTHRIEAVAGSDYQAASGTLTFAPGDDQPTRSWSATGWREPSPLTPATSRQRLHRRRWGRAPSGRRARRASIIESDRHRGERWHSLHQTALGAYEAGESRLVTADPPRRGILVRVIRPRPASITAKSGTPPPAGQTSRPSPCWSTATGSGVRQSFVNLSTTPGSSAHPAWVTS
jgi:hypothetical protein